MIMYIFCGSIILSILLLSLSGLSGHPIGERSAMERSPNPVNIQNVKHKPNECTPARQAEQDNTQDIACILDTFEPFIDSLYQQDTLSDCSTGESVSTFPALYRSLVETLSQFEGTNLAMNYSEAVCMLKNIVQPSLNTTVRNYCNCATGGDSVSCSSSQQSEISSGSNNEQCLLRSLSKTLKRLQDHLEGQGVTCRRASSDQQRALLNFNETIYDYYNSLLSQEIFETPFPRESRSTCRYAGFNMTDHVRSLYTLVPPLSNLTSSEAQLISGNLTEVILPIVRPLVDRSFGEGFFERAINSSTPLASVSTLSEDKRTACFVNRLRRTYLYFMSELRDRDIITQNDSCRQYSS